MTICIAVTGKGRTPTTFVFQKDEVHLGRSSSNDIVFDPVIDGAVSRRHAVLRRVDGCNWLLEDLGSTQGTYLNDRRVAEQTGLRSGDVLTLGVEGPNVTLVWEEAEDSSMEMEKLLRRHNPAVFPLALYGDFASRFHIYQKIGEGGYGEVWRARPQGERNWSAIKFLRPELLSAGSSSSNPRIDKLVQRFAREAEFNRRLSDATEGIARVHEAGGDPREGFLYMILDYVEGKSLDHIVAANRELSEGRVCNIIRQVCEALHVAHTLQWTDEDGRTLRGIIHRDIKPSNIMVRRADGRVILLDFGIAGIQEGGERLTLPQMRVFTYKFTAPEVLVENTISTATDLWGVAVTAYVLLSGGYFPYKGMGLAETLRMIRENQMTPLTDYRAGLSPDLVELVHRCLDPEPAKRLQTAAEWVDAMAPLAEEDSPLLTP